MAATHKSAGGSTVSSAGSEAPKRKARRSPKARSAKPAVEVSPPSKLDTLEIAPPVTDAIRIPQLMASSGQVLGPSRKKPVTKSSAPIVGPASPPLTAANPEPVYLKNLTRERVVWGVAVAVPWTVTLVALLRLGII
jgi:hypothetical protein